MNKYISILMYITDWTYNCLPRKRDSMTKRIVVTVIGLVTPLGLDRNETWESLISGNSGIDKISSFDSEGFETTIAGEVKGFNPENIIGKKESRRLDRFSQFAATRLFTDPSEERNRTVSAKTILRESPSILL